MKTLSDLSLKKLISLIKTDINKKENKITATGLLKKETDGTVTGLETLEPTVISLATVATSGSYTDLINKPEEASTTIVTWTDA